MCALGEFHCVSDVLLHMFNSFPSQAHTVYSPPSPAGGPLLLFIMNVMGAYHISALNRNEELSQFNLTYQRLVETFKYGFALRTRLGDPACPNCSDFAQEILSLQYNMTTYVSYCNLP